MKKLVTTCIKFILSVPVLGALVFRLIQTLGNIGGKFFKLSQHMSLLSYYNPQVKSAIGGRQSHGDRSAYERYLNQLQMQVSWLKQQPLISILLPVYKVPVEYLREAIDSVRAQVYTNWELCVVDDNSGQEDIALLLQEYKTLLGSKFSYKIRSENGHICHASNDCLAMSRGDYIAYFDHDDRLYPNALAEMVRAIYTQDQPDVLYSDERLIDSMGEPLYLPILKPNWSPIKLLAYNYVTHLAVYKRQVLLDLGGVRVGYEGAQDHDVMLRVASLGLRVVHVPFCLYQWRSHSGSTASGMGQKSYAATNGIRVVQDHLNRLSLPFDCHFDERTGHYKLGMGTWKPSSLVSIIIPNKNSLGLLKTCMEGLVRSTYPNLEVIIVDNDSEDRDVLAYYDKIAQDMPFQVSVVFKPGPFNFAAMNNVGASRAKGEYLVLLNNDTEVIANDWVEQLLLPHSFKYVAVSGAKLLYRNGTIQHAGLTMLDRSIAAPLGWHLPQDSSVNFWALSTMAEVSGITGACLMVKAAVYHELGGLDEVAVPNGFGDVEFGIKVRKAGYTMVYCPEALLYHDESPTRKSTYEFYEKNYLVQNYAHELMNDPYLNPNHIRGTSWVPDIANLWFDLDGRDFMEVVRARLS